MKAIRHIGIVGIPGSGKTALAEAIKEKTEAKCGSCNTMVLDDYALKVAEENEILVGRDATYLGNLFILLRRIGMERQIVFEHQPTNLITCGTLIDSAVYASMNAVTGQSELHLIRATNFMNISGSIFQDTFRYAPVLFLNKPDEQDSYWADMNDYLFMALSVFKCPFTPLNSTDPLETNLEKALEAIEEVKRQERTPPEVKSPDAESAVSD